MTRRINVGIAVLANEGRDMRALQAFSGTKISSTQFALPSLSLDRFKDFWR